MISLSMFALQALILAGGGSPKENYNSHLVHIESLIELLERRGVSKKEITVFWADGESTSPDRAVRVENPLEKEWLIKKDGLDKLTDPGPTLRNTQIEGIELQPAKRSELKRWLENNGPKLGSDDTLLFAVTDHGEPDPNGGNDTAITLWGERWTVEEMAADLKPVNENARLVIWMSQCHSGGFADLFKSRERICGAFSAEPHRPAYGCFPELAGRPDVGHFMRLVEGLSVNDNISSAHNQVLLTDDTPDTPHLMSDVLLMNSLKADADAKGVEFSDWVEGALILDGQDPRLRHIAEIATQYGLGVVGGYQRALEILAEIDAALYALDAWEDRWSANMRRARRPLTEPIRKRLLAETKYTPSRKRRLAILEEVEAVIADAEKHGERIMAIGAKLKATDALKKKLEIQEAAAIRIAYLFMGLVDPKAMSQDSLRRYREMQRCEQTPLWPEAPKEDGQLSDSVIMPPPMTPVSRNVAHVEGVRPGYFGLGYGGRKGEAGAEVRSLLAGGPAAASGLNKGDLITLIDGEAIDYASQLADFAVLTKPGQSRSLWIRRQESQEMLTITAAPMPLPIRSLEPSDVVPSLRLTPYNFEKPLVAVAQGQPLVLFFWATWCGPCKTALKPLESWAQKHGASVIAITSERRSEVDDFLKRRKGPFPFPIALDGNGSVSSLFKARQFPTFVYVDGTGIYRDRGIGYKDAIPLAAPSSNHK